MLSSLTIHANSVQKTESFAADFGKTLQKHINLLPITVFFEGGIGAGKTAWCRYLLRNMGYRETVPSPTYTLIENYKVDIPFYHKKNMQNTTKQLKIIHVDGYRLSGLQELFNLGIEDYIAEADLILIEWPDTVWRNNTKLFIPDLKIGFKSPPELQLSLSSISADCHAEILCPDSYRSKANTPPLEQRDITITPFSDKGELFVKEIHQLESQKP